MHFVQSKVSATWRTPTHQLVRCLVEEALWCVDGKPTEVERGLVVAFSSDDDAAYFLTCHSKKEMPRCELVTVGPGDIVAFQDEWVAQYFVERGQATSMTEQQVTAILEQHYLQRLSEAETEAGVAETEGEDDMDKENLENKAAVAPSQTKATQPAPSTKKPAKKGK